MLSLVLRIDDTRWLAGETAESPDWIGLLALGFVGFNTSENGLAEIVDILLKLVDGAPCGEHIDLGGKVGVAVVELGF